MNPCHTFVAPALRSLQLNTDYRFCARQPIHQLRFQPFLDLIWQASHLRELRFAVPLLEWADELFTDIPSKASSHSVVDLSRLQYLGLDGSPTLCRRLLESVRIAPHTVIHYCVTHVLIEEEVESTSCCLSLLRSMRPQLGYLGHQSLALGISPDKIDLGLSCRVNLDRVWPAEGHQPHVYLSLRFRNKEPSLKAPNQSIALPQYLSMIRAFLTIVNTDNMLALDLSLCRIAHAEVIQALCSRTFTKLADVTSDIITPAYILALSRQASIAPSLKSLRIVNVKRVKSRTTWAVIWHVFNQTLNACQGRIASVRFCTARFVFSGLFVQHMWATRITSWFYGDMTFVGIEEVRKVVEEVVIKVGNRNEISRSLDWEDGVTWANPQRAILWDNWEECMEGN